MRAVHREARSWPETALGMRPAVEPAANAPSAGPWWCCSSWSDASDASGGQPLLRVSGASLGVTQTALAVMPAGLHQDRPFATGSTWSVSTSKFISSLLSHIRSSLMQNIRTRNNLTSFQSFWLILVISFWGLSKISNERIRGSTKGRKQKIKASQPCHL